MASLTVMTAVSSRVASNWSYTTIIDPNETASVPTDNAAFLEILYPVATEEPISFGSTANNAHEELGTFRICLYIPIGTEINPTATPWMTRIETLMAQFRGVRFSSIDCIGFVGPTIWDDSDDGAYFEISFAVSYRYIKFG